MRCRVGINAEGGGRSRPERRDHGAGLPCRTATTAPTESSDGDAQYLSDDSDDSSGSGGRSRISATRRTYPVFPLDNLDNLVGSFRVSRGRIWPDEFPAHTSPPCQWQRSTYFLCFSP